jgi:hypothetical protein
VRAATALYKRIVGEAVRLGVLGPEELVGPTDEELLYEIRLRAARDDREEVRRISDAWIPALRHRRLPKRALELTARDLVGVTLPGWVSEDSPERRQLEDRLASDLDLAPGEVLVDFPVKRKMLDLDLLIRRPGGGVERLGEGGVPGLIDLPRLAEELYRTTRVLRVFTLERRELTSARWFEVLGSIGVPEVPNGGTRPGGGVP